MWIVLSFISALCLGFYDISKKVALRCNRVMDVLTLSVCISAVLLSVPWCLSRVCPEIMTAMPFYVPSLDLKAHGLVTQQLGLCLYIPQTSALVRRQPDAGNPSDVDFGGCVVAVRGAPERMAMAGCESGDRNGVCVLVS